MKTGAFKSRGVDKTDSEESAATVKQGCPRRAEAPSRAPRLATRAERRASALRRLGPDPDLVPRGTAAPARWRLGSRCRCNVWIRVGK